MFQSIGQKLKISYLKSGILNTYGKSLVSHFFMILFDMIKKTGKSHASFVFTQIIDWIHQNPLNCGPNYKCSQEISLRILNWVFALYYYRTDKALTEEVFDLLIRSIYGQMKHVRTNINFQELRFAIIMP